MKIKRSHIEYLIESIAVSKQARKAGNTPFGAILVDAAGDIVLSQGNVELTESNCTGHAERTLMEQASKRYSREELWHFTLYTSAEPCAMCAGAIYWGNVGTVVYGISEKRLAELTGDDEQNPTLDLPCRIVFAQGRKPIQVIGPIPEVEEAAVAVHEGYWT
ncbi:tRNA(Arg) A34 adenosine deaminase TadA [Paenibacillus endophyticus]|uniref:tRNA(Arg) A34 adenosine deaminase TadA n=1 Tax=Paenibacillus endophyticus TaxID=1294268 RepID=A0A7W5C6E9_9BACL|nr:nucleoside deaminase [Paenibacillus endophyticus]MBB3151956.1 tRNA(Arg) A34 adenosine deaminase TadA [Paenibacillus endophyticus]